MSDDATRGPFEVDPWLTDVSASRGRMLSGARLSDRARSLAEFHGAPSGRGRSEVLLARFAETQAKIRRSYDYLSREVRAVRDPTPAEEWLLDNAHVVEDQLREVAVDLPRGYLRELPRIGHGALREHPRVYALCVDYLCHTDARVEPDALTLFVEGYQSARALTIGELWAVPIMLRLGLLMIVARVATLSAEDAAHTRARRVAAAIAADPARVAEALRALPLREVTEAFVVDLWHAIRQYDVDPSAVADFVADRAKHFGASVEDLSRRQHLLGSAESPECRIDAIAQAWSELSGAVHGARARMAVDSALDELVMPDEAIMLLLKPAFTGAGVDPGYIASYPPGVRENGGQYTHGVLWIALALCKQGRAEAAWDLLRMLNPVNHGDSPERARKYRVEPYVVAADVYGPGEHLGRGGWTWYTGAAGWMYRITLEGLLGVEVRGERLSLKPCVPRAWEGYAVTLRRGEAEYHIEVENPDHRDTAASSLDVTRDGVPTDATRISLVDDGRRHEVRVRIVAPTTRRPTAPPQA